MLEVLVTDIGVLATDIEVFVRGRSCNGYRGVCKRKILEGYNSCKGREALVKAEALAKVDR